MTKIQAQALRDAGAMFVRQGKHLVYRLPNGRNIIVSRSPSDHRFEQNWLKELRKRASL